MKWNRGRENLFERIEYMSRDKACHCVCMYWKKNKYDFCFCIVIGGNFTYVFKHNISCMYEHMYISKLYFFTTSKKLLVLEYYVFIWTYLLCFVLPFFWPYIVYCFFLAKTLCILTNRIGWWLGAYYYLYCRGWIVSIYFIIFTNNVMREAGSIRKWKTQNKASVKCLSILKTSLCSSSSLYLPLSTVKRWSSSVV